MAWPSAHRKPAMDGRASRIRVTGRNLLYIPGARSDSLFMRIHGLAMSNEVVVVQVSGSAVHLQPASSPLPKEISSCEIDNLIRTAVHDCTHDVEAKAGHLSELDCGRHGEFLPVDNHIEKRGTIMCEGPANRAAKILWLFNTDAENTACIRHFCKGRIL